MSFFSVYAVDGILEALLDLSEWLLPSLMLKEHRNANTDRRSAGYF